MTASPKTVTRPGFIRECPVCGGKISFTFLNVQFGVMPFFYSDSGKSVLIRRSDAERLGGLLDALQKGKVNEATLQHETERLLASAPSAPDGSRFALWANVKCPKCEYEFPYNAGVRSILRKLTDPKIPLIDGMHVIADTQNESYTIKVHPATVSG